MIRAILRLDGYKGKSHMIFRACEDRSCICFANSLGFDLVRLKKQHGFEVLKG